MFILKKIETDREGYFNLETALCVSENKELLIEYHRENEGSYCLVEEYTDFEKWCKANNKDYYAESSYCTIGEIEVLT